MSYTLHVQVCMHHDFVQNVLNKRAFHITNLKIRDFGMKTVHYRPIVNMLVTKMRVYYFKLEAFHIKYILYAQKKSKKWNENLEMEHLCLLPLRCTSLQWRCSVSNICYIVISIVLLQKHFF